MVQTRILSIKDDRHDIRVQSHSDNLDVPETQCRQQIVYDVHLFAVCMQCKL